MGFWKNTWNFLWHDDSILSWIVNVIIAFILVKFVLYPGIGLMLGTDYPIVAVISGSMEHEENFENWWQNNEAYYKKYNITKEAFKTYPFKNGFNKGDIMILKGKEPKAIKVGDVVVYQSNLNSNPIIHRVITITNNGTFMYATKGDHNKIIDPQPVQEQQIQHTGIAVFKIPYLGWIKILFSTLIGGN
ncbi:MAG: signal peptidase I [Nanoarchaeota archaeon]|nr:signal peptidase I [Nanoarchaeota archaeon]